MTIIKYRPKDDPMPYEQVVKNLAEAYPDYPCVRCKRVKDRGGCTKTTDCADWAAWFGKTWEGFKKGAVKNDIHT